MPVSRKSERFQQRLQAFGCVSSSCGSSASVNVRSCGRSSTNRFVIVPSVSTAKPKSITSQWKRSIAPASVRSMPAPM